MYITLDENNDFKRNSTAVNTKGSQALTDIAGIVKSHDDMVVSADSQSSATGYSASSDQGAAEQQYGYEQQ